MPVSTNTHLTFCTSILMQLAPRSLLDIGSGFGLWGFLAREYLDVMNGRVQPEQWEVRIDGIELFEPYIQAHQRHLYDSIRIGDIRQLADELPRYDVILAGDVIEHLEKDEGLEVIAKLHQRADKALVVNIPLGTGWDHPEAYGNPGELHRSQWEIADFDPYNPAYNVFELPCGQYGVFVCFTQESNDRRLQGYVEQARIFLEREMPAQAEELLHHVLDQEPGNNAALTMLSERLLLQNRSDEALALFDRALEYNAADHHARLMQTMFLRAVGREREAREIIAKMLSTDSLPGDVRAEAEHLLEERGQG